MFDDTVDVDVVVVVEVRYFGFNQKKSFFLTKWATAKAKLGQTESIHPELEEPPLPPPLFVGAAGRVDLRQGVEF